MTHKQFSIRNFLDDIETGSVELTPIVVPSSISSGNLTYNASNGWAITIFVDAQSWDYIEEIKTNDGIIISFDDLDKMPEFRNYLPPLEVVKMRYGLSSVGE